MRTRERVSQMNCSVLESEAIILTLNMFQPDFTSFSRAADYRRANKSSGRPNMSEQKMLTQLTLM